MTTRSEGLDKPMIVRDNRITQAAIDISPSAKYSEMTKGPRNGGVENLLGKLSVKN